MMFLKLTVTSAKWQSLGPKLFNLATVDYIAPRKGGAMSGARIVFSPVGLDDIPDEVEVEESFDSIVEALSR